MAAAAIPGADDWRSGSWGSPYKTSGWFAVKRPERRGARERERERERGRKDVRS